MISKWKREKKKNTSVDKMNTGTKTGNNQAFKLE